MHKHTQKTDVKVTGNMNEEDSAIVGKMYARVALLAVKYTGLAGLVLAAGKVLHWLRWW